MLSLTSPVACNPSSWLGWCYLGPGDWCWGTPCQAFAVVPPSPGVVDRSVSELQSPPPPPSLQPPVACCCRWRWSEWFHFLPKQRCGHGCSYKLTHCSLFFLSPQPLAPTVSPTPTATLHHPYCQPAPHNTAQYPDLFPSPPNPHPQCHPAPHNSISSPFSPHYPTLMPPFPTWKQFCTQPCSLSSYSTATQPHTTQLYQDLFSQPHLYFHPTPPSPKQHSSVPSPVLSAPPLLPPSPTEHSSVPRPVLSAPPLLPPCPTQHSSVQVEAEILWITEYRYPIQVWNLISQPFLTVCALASL